MADDGWTQLEREVNNAFGEDFIINPNNCKTCFFRQNVVTHTFVDTACGYFIKLGLFSLHPEYVKFAMIMGCINYQEEFRENTSTESPLNNESK